MYTFRNKSVSVLALVAALALCATAYQYPILMDNQMRHSISRSDDSQQISRPIDENEAQHLRQLHQVVDTMAQLLTEQEQQQQRDLDQHSNSGLPQEPVPNHQNSHELMSESEIRLALEELEKVQQQEKQAAESRQRPVVADAPTEQQNQQQQQQQQLHESQAQAQDKKDSAYETLIDELGDELIDEQLNMASQEAERLFRQRDPPVERQPNKQSQHVERKTESFKPVSTPSSPPVAQQNNTPAPAPLPAPQSLYIGQLDSQGSELGPALTNDFYSFHAADAKAAEHTPPSSSAQEPASPSSPTSEQMMFQQEAAASDIPRKFDLSSQPQNDLDSAAQTRNSRHESQTGTLNPFQRDHTTIRFDLTQPSNFNGPPQQSNSPDNLVRQFRQQTGSIIDNGQFLTSTLVPIAGSDHFWRPGSNGDQQADGNTLNQQFNTVRGSSGQHNQQQQHNLPPLPSPRFQSLSPPNQFSQPTPLARQQPAQVHFAGHSFVPSNGQPQFQQPQLFGANTRDRTFSSTSSPMISVLSGSDTNIGNSVSWNPPATINPPPSPQKLFNQQFITSTQSSKPIDTTYYSPPSRGPPSPLFGSSFQTLPAERSQPISLRPQPAINPSSSFFANTTEVNNQPETTTEERTVPSLVTTTSTQKSVTVPQVATVSQREPINSEPQPSIRTLNNQRYFSPNDLADPTSTSSSVYSDPSRASRTPLATTTSVTTTSTTTPASVAANTTKKDDMVIYYYYYYDDNKNATVVAKNVTSRPPTLDEAIEADGGVEDTPYIDDPAPVTNLRTSSFKPTTTTTTTTTTPSSVISSTRSTSTSDNRLRNQFSSAPRAQVPTHDPSPKLNHHERIPEESTNSINLPHSDLRHLPSPTNRVPSIHSGRFVSDGVTSFTPNPIHVPTTATFTTSTSRSSNRGSPFSSDTFTNTRTVSTESSRPAQETSTHQLDSFSSTTPRNRGQTDFSHNAHNNQQVNALSRLPNNPSSTPSQVSSTTNVNRGSLSNASRYGTTNNLLMDPYGLDPAAPSTLLQSGHPFANDVPVNPQHKNWQPAQSIRKPSPVPSTPGILASIPTEQTQLRSQTSSTSRSSNNQHFSSQRNSNIAPTPNPLPARLPNQIATTQSVPRGGIQNPTSISSTTSKQLFPETNVNIQAGERVINDPQNRSNQKQPTSNQKQQPSRNIASQALSEGTLIRQSSQILDEAKETPLRVNFNGRPSTSEGNTGNGFTRSPIQISSPVTSFSSSLTTQRLQNNERVSLSSSSPVSSTQSSLSTPSSKSTSPQTSISTSVTQTITPSSPAVITVTQSTSSTSSSSTSSSSPSSPSSLSTSSSSATPLPSSEDTTPTQMGSSSTNTPTQESSTESSDTSGGTTRRRFGNRNSRFQTRLSSLSASSSRSTSTTTTTSTPSSTSTTRRPTISTTRKTSKQLFAGRRRLSSFSQPETNSVTTNSSNNNLTDSASTPQPVETPVPTSSPSSPPGRARFGNSFTSRTTSSTPTPVAGPEQSSPTLRPTSLFGAQRTNKARLPFLKLNKPSTTTTGADSTTVPSETSSGVSRENPEMMSTNFSSEKLATVKSTDPQDDTSENSLSSLSDDESLDKKDTAPATSSRSVNEVTTTVLPTTSSTTPETPSGRNKLKVRPLFASRQRNTSLFGNRRTNSTSTSS